jgi:hypothetical protein
MPNASPVGLPLAVPRNVRPARYSKVGRQAISTAVGPELPSSVPTNDAHVTERHRA